MTINAPTPAATFKLIPSISTARSSRWRRRFVTTPVYGATPGSVPGTAGNAAELIDHFLSATHIVENKQESSCRVSRVTQSDIDADLNVVDDGEPCRDRSVSFGRGLDAREPETAVPGSQRPTP